MAPQHDRRRCCFLPVDLEVPPLAALAPSRRGGSSALQTGMSAWCQTEICVKALGNPPQMTWVSLLAESSSPQTGFCASGVRFLCAGLAASSLTLSVWEVDDKDWVINGAPGGSSLRNARESTQEGKTKLTVASEVPALNF